MTVTPEGISIRIENSSDVLLIDGKRHPYVELHFGKESMSGCWEENKAMAFAVELSKASLRGPALAKAIYWLEFILKDIEEVAGVLEAPDGEPLGEFLEKAKRLL